MNEDIKKYIGEESPGYCFEDLPGRDFWKTILASYWNEETMDDFRHELSLAIQKRWMMRLK